MRKMLFVLFLIFTICLGLGAINIFANVGDNNEELIPDGARKIVVFRKGIGAQEKNDILVRHGAKIRKHFLLVNASSIVLPDDADRTQRELLGDGRIERIENDLLFSIRPQGSKISPQASQVTPWNISRIRADLAWGTAAGNAVKVAILDTGIQLNHPDLSANIKGGINTINPAKNPNDDNGHGTHVAGIVAAVNNSSGVVGVAPRAYLYAVKVLGASGSGWLSDIIEGLDWCVGRGIKVANMSFGSSSDSLTFHEAITNAFEAGMVLVAAAGNDGGPALYPAAYSEVISVAASDSNNQIPSWSNQGKIDFTAPGVNIYSTYRSSKYRTLSGTSMASPHVAGVCALLLQLNPAFSPSQVYSSLSKAGNCIDLGYTQSRQGFGLVDAYNTITNP